MLRFCQHPARVIALGLCLLGCAALAPLRALAQDQNQTETNEPPVFNEYKGVRLGMTTEEARQKLGVPQEKSAVQDFYTFSDKETAQISYDAQHHVAAIAVFYLGTDKAPLSKTVLGADLAAKPDGSMYRLVRYPKVGCWVSYARTSGDAPLVTVMMQKYKP
ncbi:MAG TPA: hypothetical protein VF525_16755 [Pyrinomonadaceae bacterium]|jgi:hypothetical protein